MKFVECLFFFSFESTRIFYRCLQNKRSFAGGPGLLWLTQPIARSFQCCLCERRRARCGQRTENGATQKGTFILQEKKTEPACRGRHRGPGFYNNIEIAPGRLGQPTRTFSPEKVRFFCKHRTSVFGPILLPSLVGFFCVVFFLRFVSLSLAVPPPFALRLPDSPSPLKIAAHRAVARAI